MGRLTKNEFESNFLQSIYTEARAGVDDLIKQSQSNSTTLTALELLKSVTDSYASPAKLTVGGATLYNAVVNGDFSNGTTGWTAECGTSSVANNVHNIIGDGTANYARIASMDLRFKPKLNDKVFVRARVKVTNSNTSSITIFVRNNIISPLQTLITLSLPVINKWYDLYAIVTASDNYTNGFRVYINSNYPDAATANGKVMEVDGNAGIFAIPMTGTPYENYTADQMNALVNTYFEGLKSTNKMEILTRNSNLIPNQPDMWEQGNINPTTGELQTDPTILRLKNYIKIKPNTNYTHSRVSGFATGIRTYDKNKTFIRSVGSTTFTSSASEVYVKVILLFSSGLNITTSNLESAKPILNEGSTALPYAPYVESKAKIQCTDETKFTLAKLPNNVKNEILINDGKWKAIKRIERYVLQSADITALNVGANLDTIVLAKKTNSKSNGSITDAKNRIIPNFLASATIPTDTTTNVGLQYDSSNTAFALTVAKGTYASLAAAQTALAGTVIYYELATPITIEEKDLSSYGIQVEGLLATNNAYTEFIVNDYDMLGDVGIEYSINLAKAIEELKDGQITEREFRVRQNLINLEFDARIKLLETPTP